MIIKETDALERLNSPLNLINRLRATQDKPRKSAMNLFGIGGASRVDENTALVSPFKPPTFATAKSVVAEVVSEKSEEIKTPSVDNLLENADSKIKLAQVHDLALNTLHTAITTLDTKLDDIKPEKLSQVVTAMGKTVNDIRKEQNEAARGKKDRDVTIVFYTPEQRKLSDYAVIDV
jgi:hypothetical protein